MTTQTPQKSENPYQPPNSNLSNSLNDIEDNTADRGQRFIAAIVDMIIGISSAIPIWILTGTFSNIMKGIQPSLMTQVGMGLYGIIVFALIHGYTLNRYGQTIGKRLTRIYIANTETNQKADIKDIILRRFLPVTLIAYIPVIGGLIALIDVLMIFRKDKRCGHDLIANTKVLKAPVGY